MPALVNLKETDSKKKWLEWVENNLELQLKISEDKFKTRIDEGKLTIVWAVLDIDNSYWEWIWKIHIKKIIWNQDCDFDIDY
jgi:hypothetical protein